MRENTCVLGMGMSNEITIYERHASMARALMQ